MSSSHLGCHFVTSLLAHQRQTYNFSKEEIKDSSQNRDSQKVSPGGFKPVTLLSIAQRGTTNPTTAAGSASNLCYLCNNLINVQ